MNGDNSVRAVIVALSMATLSACNRANSASEPSKAEASVSVEASAGALAVAPANREQLTIPHAEITIEVQGECKQICNRSRQLKCKHEDQCMSNCIAMATVTPCSESLHGMYRCLVNQPLANWECADDGVAAIKDGFCDREQSQAVGCMEAKMQPKK
jgi:hypothetical protein